MFGCHPQAIPFVVSKLPTKRPTVLYSNFRIKIRPFEIPPIVLYREPLSFKFVKTLLTLFNSFPPVFAVECLWWSQYDQYDERSIIHCVGRNGVGAKFNSHPFFGYFLVVLLFLYYYIFFLLFFIILSLFFFFSYSIYLLLLSYHYVDNCLLLDIMINIVQWCTSGVLSQKE